MEENIKMKAKTYVGLEDVLGRELLRLHANDVETELEPGVVTFSGDKFLLYQANYECRTALKIYKEMLSFEFGNSDEFYQHFKSYIWSKILNIYKSFRIEVIGDSEILGSNDDIKASITNIITEYFFAKSHKQPPHDIPDPAVVMVVETKGNKCEFLLDSSGVSLTHRGYKVATGNNQILDEVACAGIVQLSGWKSNTNFIDPMCGIGTMAIEAAMFAYNIPAQICREKFGFFTWRDFDEELWKDVKEDGRLGLKHNGDFTHRIIGYVGDDTQSRAANQNVRKGMMDRYVEIVKLPADEIIAPAGSNTVVITAPKIDTYNQEATNNTIEMLKMLAKRTFKDNSKTWIISTYENMPKAIGIQPTKSTEIEIGSEKNILALY